MKKILCCFFILISVKLFAQTTPLTDTSTIEGLYQYIFAKLDKTQIPTGYLEEYGVPMMSMQPFNGVLTDSNKVDMNTWRTLYWEMNTAYVGTGTNAFVSPVSMNTTIKSLIVDGSPTPIPVLFANYNDVKPSAFNNNLLKIQNNQVLDVTGRTSSPYSSKKLFAACPAVTVNNTGTASFIFKQSGFFKNVTSNVTSFYIDFGNGSGYQAVGWNSPITASYSDTGTKHLKIKMVLNNGTTYECYSDYYVGKISVSQKPSYSNSYDTYKYFPATANYSGGYADIKYSIKGTERSITKPLIVVEGYDAHSAAPDVQTYNYDYYTFIDAISNEPLPGYDFNYHLDDIAGYDLIFVDFNNGTDDIKRNAAFLKDVITWVNQQKTANGSTQQNVVMGMSMGGLIARYALADMTKTLGSASTGTRLLITHDSPHRGANVPLGLQFLIEMAGHASLFGYDIRDVYPQYDEAINLLNQSATQQLLLYRATGETTSVGNTFLDGEYRSKITFNTGDPQPSYQFVATSLGSECGNALYPAYQQLIDADADAFLFILPVLLSYHFHTDIQVNALPNTGSTSQIAKTAIKSKFKLFGLITIYKDVYNKTAYAPGNQIPLDGAPGGTEGVANTYVPNVNVFLPIPGLLGILGYVYAYLSVPYLEIDFVPAGSALDISPFNSNTISQKFVAGSNPNYPSTSKTYIAQETFTQSGRTISNNTHIQFTARNSQWMFDQMENIADNLNCSSACQPDYKITGLTQFCSSTSTYSIAGLASGSSVTWSVSPAGYATPYPITGPSTTLTKQANGNITLTATISPCNQVITLPITVGAPSVNVTGAPSFCNSNGSIQTWLLNAAPSSNGSNWNWYVSYLQSGSIYIYNPTSSSTNVDVSGGGVVSVHYTDLCGVTQTAGGPTLYNSCPRNLVAYQVVPNPAKNNIVVSANNTTYSKNSLSNLMYAIKITNHYGVVIKSFKYNPGIKSVNISLSGINSGAYLVSIFDGSKWNSESLIIQK